MPWRSKPTPLYQYAFRHIGCEERLPRILLGDPTFLWCTFLSRRADTRPFFTVYLPPRLPQEHGFAGIDMTHGVHTVIRLPDVDHGRRSAHAGLNESQACARNI